MPTPAELTARMARDRMRIASALDRGGTATARAKRVNIWGLILEAEISSGSTFMLSTPEGLPYVSLGLTKEIFYIPRAGRGGDGFLAYLNRRYGLNESEQITRYIIGEFRNYAVKHGARVQLRRFSMFKQNTVYISGYDGTMWKIDGQDILPIPNGEDDVFFVDDDSGKHIEPEVGTHGHLFERLVDSISFAESGMGGISDLQMRRAYLIWIFALAFPDLLPTKPLLILEGSPGSGKSAAVQLLQLALLGEAKPIILSRNKEDDFGILLLRSPICVFDNLDAYIEWLPDAICAYTTAGKWTRRRLFTDSEELVLKPHAFIAVASKNPASFRREDVADRCLILRLERRRESIGFSALEQEVNQLRHQIFGEYLHYVNKIVDEIRCGAMQLQDSESFRMADFAAFARVVGRVLEWEDGAVDDLLVALQSEQGSFINEEDPLVDLLYKWAGYTSRNGQHNIGRDVALFELHQELESIAQALSMNYYKSARVLAQKLRSPHLERDFVVVMTASDGHKRYRIWRRTDARLSSVPMPQQVIESED